MLHKRIFACVILSMLAGCGGAGSHIAPAVSPPTAASPAPVRSSATFTITIPPKGPGSSSRTPHYVSTATQSVVITLLSVNGTPYTGSPAVVASNLTTANPACSGVPLTCTIVAPAVVGNDLFNVVTYDSTQTSLSPTVPQGHALSQASVSVTVVVNQANVAPPLVLQGIPVSVSFVPQSDPHVVQTQSNAYQLIGNQPHVFIAQALDAAGKVIIDPGAPIFSVTVQNGSSAIVATQAGASNAFNLRARRYSATPVTVSVATVPGSVSTSVALSTVQELWVANSGNSTITGYAGSPPTPVAGDMITAGLLGPTGLAFDSNGVLWVSNYGNVTAYAGTTQILTDTITTGLNRPSALAFDASGNLWVGDWPSNSLGSVNAYSGTSQLSGNTIANPQSSTSGLWGPRGLAFDSNGLLWVANGGGSVNTVTAYSGTTQLTASTITLGVSGPYGLAFDGSGHLWVANSNSNSVTAYAGSTPIAGTTISGLTSPAGLAFDAQGNLWVANQSTGVGGNKITAYAGTAQLTSNTISGLNAPTALVFAPGATLPASSNISGPTPIPTPTPPVTPNPTPTPGTPTPTPTPTPSSTATPTPTPTPTPTATPTPTPGPPLCTQSRTSANQCTLPSLTFTSISPSTVTTSVSDFEPLLTASGLGFSNVRHIHLLQTGPGSAVFNADWDKATTADWNQKVAIQSNTQMVLHPRLTAPSDQYGTSTWTVTLTDTANQTAHNSFTLVYAADAYPYKNSAIDVGDAWAFDTRECTSYVAWRLNRDGIPFSNSYGFPNSTKPNGWHDASNWQSAALKVGLRVDHSPVVGAVAWFSYNHVAYVSSITSDGSIVLEEYNYHLNHNYDTRTIPASSVDWFIHFQ